MDFYSPRKVAVFLCVKWVTPRILIKSTVLFGIDIISDINGTDTFELFDGLSYDA